MEWPHLLGRMAGCTYIPVEAPLGTAARNMPFEVKRSTSTVGLPRLSTIWRALIFVMTPGTAFFSWSAWWHAHERYSESAIIPFPKCKDYNTKEKESQPHACCSESQNCLPIVSTEVNCWILTPNNQNYYSIMHGGRICRQDFHDFLHCRYQLSA